MKLAPCRTFRQVLYVSTLLFAFAIPGGYCYETPPLAARGYSVLPAPQQVRLKGADFEFGPACRLQLGHGVQPSDIAVESLESRLSDQFGVDCHGRKGFPATPISLNIQAGSVLIGSATDKDKAALENQAYKLDLSSDGIRIDANADTGLLYGVDTLIQLIKLSHGKLWLPAGEITDWPDTHLRFMLWDDRHHVDRVEALKNAVREAAFYKIDGFALMLDGHFEYKSAPAIVTPYALSPADLQDLTNYALRYHVQLIPYMDGPAHLAYILKHPEYRGLRAFPDNNYELCVTNPDSYKLLEGMYQDLLDANKGGKYFVTSTDEPYYVGLANNSQCDEATRAKQLGSKGKLLAQFVTKTSEYLHQRGRQVIMWAGYPMTPSDVSALPTYLIDRGVNYNPASLVRTSSGKALDIPEALKAHGIRGMIRTAPEGSEPMFPSYFLLPSSQLLNPVRIQDRRGVMMRSELIKTYQQIASKRTRDESDLVGIFVMGWNDDGLSEATYWLGYLTGGAWAWHPDSPGPYAAADDFYKLYYGPGATSMARVYQLMSNEAQVWNSSWDRQPSTARKPLFGNPHQIYKVRRPAHDQTLQLPPVPTGEYLRLPFDWDKENQRRITFAQDNAAKVEALYGLLNHNLGSVERHRYDIEVFLSIADLYRQNLQMIQELGEINGDLEAAEAAAAVVHPGAAVSDLDRALDTAKQIRKQRNQVLNNTIELWYRNWYPRVSEANGRHFLLDLSDVDDMLADRTDSMDYLVYREMILPLGQWYGQVEQVRNTYAKSHNLVERTDKLNWGETK